MKTEAANAGVLDTPFATFGCLQILVIEGLFAGKNPALPPQDPAAAGPRRRRTPPPQDPAAFKKAAREEDKTRQGKLI